REPSPSGFSRSGHSGSERALRTLCHRSREKREGPEGSRSPYTDARRMPRAAGGCPRAREGPLQARHKDRRFVFGGDGRGGDGGNGARDRAEDEGRRQESTKENGHGHDEEEGLTRQGEED